MTATSTGEHYELRPFQKVIAENWVRRREVANVLIADDMGLGKTVEAIDLDWQRRLARTGPWKDHTAPKTLVIAPLSAVPVWESHYSWMLPHVRVVVLNPKDRPSFLAALRKGDDDVFIMHWQALRLMPELAQKRWFHIVGDEIQAIKNRKAQVTRALKKLKTTYKTALSGTPADNSPQDFWSPLNWLWPNDFRSYWRFFNYYVDWDWDKTGSYKLVTGVKEAAALHKELKSFYIRRRKEEVWEDMPAKETNVIWVDLSPQQRKAYNAMKNDMLTWIGENQDKPLAAPQVITQLVRLQQFAAASVDVEWVQKRQLNKETGEWTEVTVPRYFMVDPSSKLDAAMELLEYTDAPVIFFSQFKTLINLFHQRLRAKGIKPAILTGDTPASERGRLVQNFQEGKTRVFAGTIRAGGVGITLTRSSHVAFFDRAWSPSWNRQAEDRAHRIGQKDAVLVTDIMARNTVDLGRAQQIEQKWTWLQMMLGDKVFDYQKQAAKLQVVDRMTEEILAAAIQERNSNGILER